MDLILFRQRDVDNLSREGRGHPMIFCAVEITLWRAVLSPPVNTDSM